METFVHGKVTIARLRIKIILRHSINEMNSLMELKKKLHQSNDLTYLN